MRIGTYRMLGLVAMAVALWRMNGGDATIEAAKARVTSVFVTPESGKTLGSLRDHFGGMVGRGNEVAMKPVYPRSEPYYAHDPSDGDEAQEQPQNAAAVNGAMAATDMRSVALNYYPDSNQNVWVAK